MQVMDNISDRIRKLIIKSMVGKVFFSQEKRSYQLLLRSVGQEEKKRIYSMIRSYPEWRNATAESLNRIYDEVRQAIDICYNTKCCSSQYLDLRDLKIGNIVKIQAKDEKLGLEEFKLMYVGQRHEYYMRFLVLYSSRLAIQPEDIMEVYDTSLWGVGHGVTFKVFRDGKRIPSDMLVYRTFPLTHISIEKPSIVHEVIDARSDFSYEEYEAAHNDNDKYQLKLSMPSMALLLNKFTKGEYHIYADFMEDGETGSIFLDEQSVMNSTDDILAFCEIKCVKAPKGIASTKERGQIRIDAESNEIKLVRKMTVE